MTQLCPCFCASLSHPSFQSPGVVALGTPHLLCCCISEGYGGHQLPACRPGAPRIPLEGRGERQYGMVLCSQRCMASAPKCSILCSLPLRRASPKCWGCLNVSSKPLLGNWRALQLRSFNARVTIRETFPDVCLFCRIETLGRTETFS